MQAKTYGQKPDPMDIPNEFRRTKPQPNGTVHPDLQAMQAEMDRLRAENEALRQAKATGRAVTIKRSEKGAMSVYGLGRFPFTFYKSQWVKFRASLDQIDQWFEANQASLTEKD